jgi:trimeric autotransporter adhesin
VYYFNLGATAPVWKDACDDFTTPFVPAEIDNFRAVAFSPNFASDQVMVAVSEQIGVIAGPVAGAVRYHIASFNQKAWDVAVFTGYPVAMETSVNTVFTCNAADIALDPEYLGGDDTTRIGFVGASILDAAVEVGGVYRFKDTGMRQEKTGTGINSVAWDGVNIAAGGYADNNVYRSADALASSPTYSASRGLKEIGIDQLAGFNDATIVAWKDSSTLVGAKSGAASAFSTSIDNGKTWNSISLIDSALTNILDFAISPDGSVKYLLTADGGEISLYRSASSWTKVFCIVDDADDDRIVRIADSNSDVVYIADRAEKTIHYSTSGGTVKWVARASRYNVQDMAVQDADIAYVAETATIKVSKTTNGGFTWATSKSTKHAGVANHTINLISDDNLVVGSTTGHVAYSTDGNGSWTKVAKVLTGQGTPLLTQVTASSLASGGYIYAASSEVDSLVERWQIGTSTTWKNLTVANTATLGCYGMELEGGVLYTIYSLITLGSELNRTNSPESSTPAAGMWTNTASPGGVLAAAGFEAFVAAPSAVSLSSGSATLWVIDQAAALVVQELWAFTDTLSAEIQVALVSPTAGYQNPVNPVSGASQDIAFSWSKPTTGNINYTIRIYSDAACTAQLQTHNTGLTASATPVVMIGPNQVVATQILTFSAGSTYYWRVRTNAPVLSSWSEVRSFTVDPLQAAVPGALSPANGGTTTETLPSFSWEPVSGATKYAFKLADNVGMSSPIVDTTLSSTGYAVDGALALGTYYWMVKAIEPVEGEWSAIANFTVEKEAAPSATAPPVVITQVPAPNITVTAPAPAPATTITIPPVEQPAPITPAFIWAVIIIGAILVIAVIVLIVRTRRTV